eukprot:2955681-Rhodomonas_salina.1
MAGQLHRAKVELFETIRLHVSIPAPPLADALRTAHCVSLTPKPNSLFGSKQFVVSLTPKAKHLVSLTPNLTGTRIRRRRFHSPPDTGSCACGQAQSVMPGAACVVVGSTASGIADCTSDLDVSSCELQGPLGGEGSRIEGSGFRVQGSGIKGNSASRVERWGVQGPGSRVQGPGSRVQGSRSRVQGSGYRVHGAGSRVKGSGSRVQGPGLTGAGSRVQGLQSVLGDWSAKSERVGGVM